LNVVLCMADSKVIEVNLPDDSLVDKVVRTLKLTKDRFRTPSIWMTSHNSPASENRKASSRSPACSERQNSNPAKHPFAVYCKLEVLFVKGTILGFQEL